jgi:hypothetical protein
MASVSDWRIGYAKQAQADLGAREWLLAKSDLPECQQLHFLQMACEKICKAYLCGLGVSPADLQSSHAYIARQLPIIARQQFATQPGGLHKDRTWMIAAIRVLARKIELLAPAVDAGGASPSNCEYPWIGPDANLKVPSEYNFQMELIHAKAGRHLIKVLYTAVDDLIQHK